MKEIKDVFPDYQDAEFLAPKSGAKLASLFGLDQAESQGNQSFQFTAPKQPKKTTGSTLGPPPQKPAPPPAAPSVLLASGVHAFRFVNGQYVMQGKLGAAVLGNHLTKEYNILLYGSQQKHISTARIHPGFILTVQPGNYSTFYDDQRQNWSLKFESEKAGIDFSKEVCIARWNSGVCVDSVMVQDVLVGEGQAVDVGDTVQVMFSAWLLQNHSIGEMFDSNVGKNKLRKVRLGSGKTQKGWEEGMVGMRKGGRRLLIIPFTTDSASNTIPNCAPPASTLLFDVEICQVKFSKDGDGLSGGSTDSASVSPVPALDTPCVENEDKSANSVSTDQRDPELQIKSRPQNEPPQQPDAAKAKLISRMAKMGQPMLPFLKGAVPAQPDPTDSEAEETMPTPPSSSSESVQMTSAPPSCTISSRPVAVQHPEVNAAGLHQQVDSHSDRAFQPYATAQLQPFLSVFPPQHMPYQTADISSFLMSEARQHNTEVRLAVARVADRVDQLASKMDDLQKQGFCSLGLSTVSLETAMILHNIQRIIQENTSLKKELLEKGSKMEEQNRKIGELIEQRQRYMEQSSLLIEQRNDALQNSSQHSLARLLQVEQEKVCLAEELSCSSSRVCELQEECVCLQQRAADLQAKLSTALEENHSHDALISSLHTQIQELKNEGEQTQLQWRADKQKSRKMELSMKIMEEEIQDLRTEKETLHQMFSERKRKWQLERERLLLDLEEQRRSSDEENQHLLQQLRRARVCTETHSRQQADLELEWQQKCDVAVKEQRENLEGVITQLQEQYAALQKKAESEHQQRETVFAVKVKRMMNGLFHSLKAQFNQQDSYTSDSVLKILLKTIKHVTMRLLTEPKEVDCEAEDDKEEEEEEEVYLSTEEPDKKQNTEESAIKPETEADLQLSLDQTYLTAEETANLSRYSSAESVSDQQPVTHSERTAGESDAVCLTPEHKDQNSLHLLANCTVKETDGCSKETEVGSIEDVCSLSNSQTM